MQTVALLTISNVFMTLAWYGHLKFKDYPLFMMILASWGIAFIEYCFQAPVNRIGHAQFSAVTAYDPGPDRRKEKYHDSGRLPNL